MRLYSELTDLPPRYGFSSVKNKGKILNFCKTDVVESFEGKFDDGSNGLMFLSERRSLRSYDLSEIDAFRKSVGLQTLGIICT